MKKETPKQMKTSSHFHPALHILVKRYSLYLESRNHIPFRLLNM